MDTPQFRKAEFAGGGPPCAVCKSTISGEYYRLSTGPTICPDCTAKFQAQQKAPSHSAFVRGVLYGAGMALACSIGYAAILLITGLEIGLVAILVGYLVGTAVRKGSQGLGGRRCQIAAVGLTYLAITFSYIPVGIQEMRKASQATKGKQEQTVKQAIPPPTASNIVVAVVMIAGFAIATPFLGLASGIGGILGMFILFLGLQRAWAITGRSSIEVHGPFQAEETTSVA